MEQILDDNSQRSLRARGLITETEIAVKAGDILFAKNVLSGEKRIIDSKSINNESKQLLKG
jgi:hypothetical protein